ncbi:acyl-CoA ligase (AMP-forming), exosortase A system-associated [Microbacterium ulmi]|uniref:Acyl-CoA ligase (AMP-forming), exosortase A system-associated n=1 Tax=Microbacterium ulmi TaxID=179095 RepID=A0A7Y2LYP8_9MICO|nr:acyl-CoA ligase (AMP-forming), exosortase A system-associated [Microbacterium ulmi]NII69725.1 acyl-CoA ligase (AMP-forming) (exosortase A-associated) [Microbacterium ulmi]NNH03300.1 acyl-CoA ligase (AMP-forming), exosortase A system-associated [Microbacterium ulmi]
MPSSIAELLRIAAHSAPDRIALSAPAGALAYAELADAADRLARALVALPLERGDRVAVFLEKRLETVVALFGIAAAGAAFVPVNPVLKPRQVAHIVGDSGATVLVTSVERWAALGSALPDGSPLAHVILLGSDAATEDGRLAVHSWPLADSPATRLPDVIDSDLAAIIYTSGSTGSPKGVALTHRNLLAGAESVNTYLGNTQDDVILAVLPLSFDAGLSQLTTGFAAGAHVVLINYLLPRDVVATCVRHGVTAITGVPPLWSQLAEQDWSPATMSLRRIATTGGRLPRATLDRLRRQLPHTDVFLMYGLTEAFRSTYLPPGEVDRRPDSIGRAIPNAEVLVLRADGTECDPGEPGELVHRGALVALGYWNDPQRTAERFRPWPPGSQAAAWRIPERAVWSGDTVVRDEDGYLFFVARADEMIKHSGYRISPTELEEAALSTGLVTEAVALGRDDPAVGQRIVMIVARAGAPVDVTALRAALRVELPGFMVPEVVVAVDDLPRNPNGKYDRARLREEHG